MQLEVGKSYRDKSGVIHKIILDDNHVCFPFDSDIAPHSFTRDGKYFLNKESDQDLIEEVKTETTSSSPLVAQLRELSFEDLKTVKSIIESIQAINYNETQVKAYEEDLNG